MEVGPRPSGGGGPGPGPRGEARGGEREQLRVPPAHMQQVASLTSMEGLSDSSQSDFEVKSRISDSPHPFGSMLTMDGAASGVESEEEVTALCSSNLKDIVTDLTFLSHEAVVGDYPVGVTVYDAQDRVIDTAAEAEAEEKYIPTYDKWKRLSGPVLLCVILGLIILIWGRGHILQLLRWLETLPLHLSILVFIFLFTLVSFPFGFGYIILNMMAGYLYGILRGQLIVMVSVAVGATLSFQLCRRWFKDYARSMVTSDALRAVLRVVEGPHGFKVIFLTRFTPIPFGLQNALFAMTTVGHWRFFFASVLGLLPIQILNTYMGSTVRNMQEVLTDRVDGYIILGVQVIISIVLMVYLLAKARRELARLTKSSGGGVQSA